MSRQMSAFAALLLVCGLAVLVFVGAPAPTSAAPVPGTLYDFTVTSIAGKPAPLSAYRGKVVLVVNTASECGFTPQYKGLEALYQELRDKGLVVLGFPCNDFGGQEPGPEAAIMSFCTEKYKVTFPMFSKVSVVKGPNQAPLYAWLSACSGKTPSWNFCKYLVGRDGRVVDYFNSMTAPDWHSLRQAVDGALAAKS